MRRLLPALAVVWTVALLVGMLTPGSGVPEVLSGNDKLVHLGAFFVFALLWMLALPPHRRLARVALLCVAFAVGTEVLQHVLPIGRFGDPADATADILGAAIGMIAVHAWTVRRVTA